MDELDLLHDLGVDIFEDALSYFQEQFDSFPAAALRGENGEQKSGLLVALDVFPPHRDEAKHVTVNLEGRCMLPHLI